MASVTYQLMPGAAITVNNSLNQAISAYCLIHAVDFAVNSISIKMVHGSSVVNGTSIQPGGISVHNIYNTQFLPITASSDATALITNRGDYLIQAECT